jgi:hypothetical protein
MKRHASLAFALIGVVLAIGLVVAITAGSQSTQDPMNSVAQVQAHLADDPHAWVGRTVRVRGRAEGCMAARGAPPLLSCRRWPAYLIDLDSPGASGALPLAWASQDGVLAFVRRALSVGGLVPRAPQLDWGALATYRVQLRATVCSIAPCYIAILQADAPG